MKTLHFSYDALGICASKSIVYVWAEVQSKVGVFDLNVWIQADIWLHR